MFQKLSLVILLLVQVLLMISCASHKHEKRDFWINNRYRELNYIDTTKLESKTIAFIVDATIAKTKNDYETALLNYMLALRHDTTVAILYSISECFFIIEKYDLAIEYAHLALKQEATFMPAYEILCKAYTYKSDIANAILSLESALSMEDNETMLLFLANLYEFQDIQKAKTLYKTLANKYKNQDALWRLINICRNFNQNENEQLELLSILEQFWKDYPSNYDIAIELVGSWFNYNMQAKFIENIDILDKNLTVDGLENMYNYALSRLFDIDSSETTMQAILPKIDKRFAYSEILNMNAGRVALQLKNLTTASKYLKPLLESQTTSDDMKLSCVLLYHEYEYKEEIKAEVNNLIEADTVNWRYPFWLSILEDFDKNYEKSLTLLQKAYKLDSTRIEVLLALGNAYFNLENYISADKIYEQILLVDSNNPTACNNFAFSLCLQEKNLDKALQLSNRALASDTASAVFLDTQGWIKYKQGKLQDAIAVLKKATLYDKDDNSDLYSHLAEIYYKLNDFVASKQAIQKALEIEPNNAELLEQKKLLDSK